MTSERFEELTSRFLSGEQLTPEEERELVQAIESDPALQAEFLGDAILDGRLRGIARDRRGGDKFTRLLTDALTAENDGTRFLKKVESQLPDPSTPRMGTKAVKPRTRGWRERPGGGGAWKAWLAAAGVFIAILAFITMSSSRPSPRNGVKPQIVQAQREEEQRRKEAENRAKAEAQKARLDRQRMEQELAAQEDERRRLAEEIKREQDAQAQERLKARETELARAVEAFQERVRLAKEKELQTEKAAAEATAAPPRPVTPATEAAAAAVARIDSVMGDAFVTSKEGRSPAKAGMELFPGQGLETAGGQSRAVLAFADKTQLALGPDTILKELKEAGGKRVLVERGTLLRGEIAKQPAAQPMVFVTPSAEAMVLGTTLRITVDLDPRKGTRLDVEEGKVELKRLADQKTVLVTAGHYAVAVAGAELVAKRLPIDEILLTAKQGRISGTEWRWAADAKASTGHSLEARATSMKGTFPPPQDYKEANCATFEFNADADLDYFIWIRARTIAKEIGYKATGKGDDAFVIEIPEAALSGDSSGSRTPVLHSVQRAFFDNYDRAPGYSWGATDILPKDFVPVTVRFPRAGRQTLRIYGVEPPIRIDTVWLSTTQKTRPEESFPVPLNAGRK